MGIFLMIILMGGKFHLPEVIGEREFKGLKEFKYKPFSLNPSRQFLKITPYERVYKDFGYGLSFSEEYLGINFDLKGNRFTIPSPSFNSYCEINFWNEIHPEIKKAGEKIKEISKEEDAASLEKQNEIMKIKEKFHEDFLKKRIEVMQKLDNQELLIETEKAYEILRRYKERREK